jgi:mannose-1-phosphate guanylyltransferase
MAGGIGSRFWPVSREEKPKQFHDMLGVGRSLIQMTWDRFISEVPAERIMVVTHESYTDLVKEHLPDLPHENILSEPHRKNTAPCIALATWTVQRKDPNAICVMASADHLILNNQVFLDGVKRAIKQAEGNDVLLTIGIKPTRPDTGYGYIQFSAHPPENINDDCIRRVKTFTEKPNAQLAAEFIASGEFYWNAGMFVWSISAITKAFETYLPEMHTLFREKATDFGTDKAPSAIEEIYATCQSISIDYGIMEKATNVLMVKTADFGWSDLGTWGSLYHQIHQDANGNTNAGKDVLFYDSSLNMVKLPAGKTAIIQGLHDYIVVDTGDVLLISKKSEEQRIKDFVADLKAKRKEK